MQKRLWKGYALSFLGVCVFALTLPMTKMALQSFSPLFITVGRVVLSGLAAALVLKSTHQKLPPKHLWPKILLTSLGVAVCFPLFIGLALKHTPSSHAAIVLAILPLITALIGSWMHQERHSVLFWMIAGSGCLTVLTYIVWRNGIAVTTADMWTLAAALAAAVGYNSGTLVSKSLGGLPAISWSLAFLLPLSIPLSIYVMLTEPTFLHATSSSLASFFYLAMMSQYLGFVPWYTGLKMGGVARVSQVQLLQTFITLAASSLFLSESISPIDWAVAGLVVVQVLIAKKS